MAVQIRPSPEKNEPGNIELQ